MKSFESSAIGIPFIYEFRISKKMWQGQWVTTDPKAWEKVF
jgi:hypothetical protein